MNPEQATALVEDVLTGIVPDADFGVIGPDTDFRQALDMDSLDFLSFVEELSARSGCRLDEDDYPALTTLGGSADLLVRRAPPAGRT